MPDGRSVPVRLIDVSVSGAAFAVDARLPVGTAVALGQTPAHVVRGFEGGAAVEFARPFSADSDPSVIQF